jgi:hypothetical protein
MAAAAAASATGGFNWRSDEFRNSLYGLSGNQFKRAEKLYSEEFYLLDVSKGTQENIHWNFYISGSKKNVYQIKYYNERKLFCNCPDSLVHCVKQGVVCKHICFFMIRVLKNRRLDFYQTKVIDNSLHEEIMSNGEIIYQRIHPAEATGAEAEAAPEAEDIIHYIDMSQLRLDDSGAGAEAGAAGYRPPPQVVIKTRKTGRDGGVGGSSAIATPVSQLFACHKNLEEVCNEDCFICYDVLGNMENILECPTCHNNMHAKCMQKWLTMPASMGTCIYCRSTEWKKYRFDR